MPGTALFEKPRWLRDLLRFLPLKSQFVLSGNIRDLQACEVVPGTVTAQSFNQTLCDALLDAGYTQVLAWDPLAGFRVLGRPGSEAGATPQVLLDLGLTPVDGAAPAGTACFIDPEAVTVWESGGPTQLSATDPTKLTDSYSVYG